MIFIDIGDYSINLDHVVNVYTWAPGLLEQVSITFDVLDGDNPLYLTFRGDDAIAFKEWWAHHRKIPELTIVGLRKEQDE